MKDYTWVRKRIITSEDARLGRLEIDMGLLLVIWVVDLGRIVDELKFYSIKGEYMVGKFKVITLCGSTKFKEEFIRVQKELTLLGYIVISVGCFGHSGDVFTEEQKIMLDDMHKRKIDMSDEIYVINKDGYVGKSTLSEIEYAMKTDKDVNYMECPSNDFLHIVNKLN